MTKKELSKMIKDILKNHDYDWETYDPVGDIRPILLDIEEQSDLFFDNILCDDPYIQVFTTIEYKGKRFDVIIDFEMEIPKDEEDLINIIWGELQLAKENKNFFKS